MTISLREQLARMHVLAGLNGAATDAVAPRRAIGPLKTNKAIYGACVRPLNLTFPALPVGFSEDRFFGIEMAVKCTGHEFLSFYNDKAWWWSVEDGASPDENTYWEYAEILVNGEDSSDLENLDSHIKPTDIVTVRGGVVLGKVVGSKEPSVEGYLKRWLKAQSSTRVLVECPKDKLDAILAAVKAAGGKIAA